MPRPTFLSTAAELVGTVDRTGVAGLTQLEPKEKALAGKLNHWVDKEAADNVVHYNETTKRRVPVMLENDDMIYEFLTFTEGKEVPFARPPSPTLALRVPPSEMHPCPGLP